MNRILYGVKQYNCAVSSFDVKPLRYLPHKLYLALIHFIPQSGYPGSSHPLFFKIIGADASIYSH